MLSECDEGVLVGLQRAICILGNIFLFVYCYKQQPKLHITAHDLWVIELLKFCGAALHCVSRCVQ